MKRIFALLQYLMRPAIAICLACLLVGPLLAAESAGEMKLQKARVALTDEPKDPVQAKKLLLDIVEHDKDTLDSQSLCYVYVYLGYIEDRAGNRNEAIPWYQKALKIKDADRVQECATFGLEKPLTWIRHLDENATPPPRQQNSPAEAKLQQARAALTGEQKDTVQAKKLLLDIVAHDKDTLDSQSLCYVYVYLGYIEDRAGNRNEAIPWYQKALKIKDADRVQECATFGLEKPLTWIRHLDEGTEKISLESAPPVVVKTVPVAGATEVDSALTEIRVTYSKPMQDGSWSWSTWGEENYPETIGKPRYLSDGCTCVLPVNLKPDKFYAIWLNNDKSKNFTDTNGIPAVPYLLTFSTKSQSGQHFQQQRPAANGRQQLLRERFVRRTAQDEGKYTPEQLHNAEQLYQVANQKWGTPEAIESLQTMLKKYPDINRAGCATLYLAQMSSGDERARYLQECIEKYNDCFYGDGAQVGPYARFILAQDCKSQGKLEKTEALFNEIKAKYADAIDHTGDLLRDSIGEDYISQQLKLAQAGNYWAEFNLWEAYSQGKHEVAQNPAEAGKWLSELVQGAYLAKFEPVNGFNPKTPKEMLDQFSEHCQLYSGRDSLGGASFFRTTKQGNKLIGSFLTATPDEFKAALEKNPNLKLISMEKVTPEMFLEHEATQQESL
jgi:tetratricopeptide (TPR) repeat protein